MSNNIKTVSGEEISNFSHSMLDVLGYYITPKEDSKLNTLTKLNDCVYEMVDIIDFIYEFERIEDFKIDIKYFDNPDLSFFNIAKNILLAHNDNEKNPNRDLRTTDKKIKMVSMMEISKETKELILTIGSVDELTTKDAVSNICSDILELIYRHNIDTVKKELELIVNKKVDIDSIFK